MTVTYTGVLGHFDTPTSDGRRIQVGALTTRDLPLPMMVLTKTTEDHQGAELCGKITAFDLDTMQATVELDETVAAGKEAIKWADDQVLGVSLDLAVSSGDIEVTEADEAGNPVTVEEVVYGAEVMGATLLPFPAFARTRLTRVDTAPAAADDTPTDEVVPDEVPELALAVDEPADTELPADPAQAVELVNESSPTTEPIEPGATLQVLTGPEGPTAVVVSAEGEPVLTAAAPLHPPATWFRHPDEFAASDPPRQVMVTRDGRIYGYIALWGTCHIGFTDRCITPPESRTSYSQFIGAATLTNDGYEMQVGVLTMDTRHPDHGQERRWSAARTKAHYEETGTAVAVINVGEDARGIWFAGSVLPHVTDEQMQRLRACRVSGDWRHMAGGYELVAALCVNTGGFPVKAIIEQGKQYAITAAGIPAKWRADEDTTAEAFTLEAFMRLEALAVRKRAAMASEDRLNDELLLDRSQIAAAKFASLDK